MEVTFSANPGYAMSWLKVSPAEILPGDAASIPLTLVVPPSAHPEEDYAILTAGGVHFDVKFSVGVPLLASASRQDINPTREPAPLCSCG
jgi:hypothetical protein